MLVNLGSQVMIFLLQLGILGPTIIDCRVEVADNLITGQQLAPAQAEIEPHRLCLAGSGERLAVVHTAHHAEEQDQAMQLVRRGPGHASFCQVSRQSLWRSRTSSQLASWRSASHLSNHHCSSRYVSNPIMPFIRRSRSSPS